MYKLCFRLIRISRIIHYFNDESNDIVEGPLTDDNSDGTEPLEEKEQEDTDSNDKETVIN